MTIATEPAASLEPTLDRAGLQTTDTVPVAAPITELRDYRMNRAGHIISLLNSLTDSQIEALPPIHRRRLQFQLERVHRMVAGAIAVSDARKAAASRADQAGHGTAAFLHELRDGRGRE